MVYEKGIYWKMNWHIQYHKMKRKHDNNDAIAGYVTKVLKIENRYKYGYANMYIKQWRITNPDRGNYATCNKYATMQAS